VTELSYFAQVKRDLRLPNFEVKHAKGNPLDIVKYAIDDPARPPERERHDRDQTWCVFDVEAPDPHPRLKEAIQLAEVSGIRCAVSNPCFEVWPILHVRDLRGYVSSKQACDLLADLHPTYSARRKVVDYLSFKPHYSIAKRRAVGLFAASDVTNIADCNPYSSVWEMMDRLFAMARANKTRSNG
jgi:hypothetical protein